MSYVVIKVYSFECDYPGCEEICEIQAHKLDIAERTLRRTEKWRVRADVTASAAHGGGTVTIHGLDHVCPNHSAS